MIEIRSNMFETNSSSVHVLVLMKTSDYKAFAKKMEEYDSLSDIVFWNRWDSGQHSDEQKFKKGEYFLDKMSQEGWVKEDISQDDLLAFAADLDYQPFETTLYDMDEWDWVEEGDITAFSFSGRD